MAFCKNCGQEVENEIVFCPHCGTNQIEANGTANAEDKGGFLWGALGCCIPIVGLILFLVWKDTKPKTAKAAGIGALVSVICSVIYYIIVFAIGIGAGLLGF